MRESSTLTAKAVPQAKGCVRYSSVSGSSSSSWSKNWTLESFTERRETQNRVRARQRPRRAQHAKHTPEDLRSRESLGDIARAGVPKLFLLVVLSQHEPVFLFTWLTTPSLRPWPKQNHSLYWLLQRLNSIYSQLSHVFRYRKGSDVWTKALWIWHSL